jgi:hypothetical protein
LLFLAPLLAVFGACLLEALLLRPRCGWRRPLGAWALQAGLILAVYALGLAVFQRPWFAAAQTLAWYLFILVVNRVKLASLREPFVFQDFEYFVDLLRHPRLYLPFFGYFNAFLGISGAGLLIAAGLWLEPGLWQQQGAWGFWRALLFSAGGASGLLWLGARAARGLLPVFDASADVARFGLLASFWLYARAERVLPALPSRFAGLAAPEGEAPHVVVVQSESFFDARRVYEGVAPSVYAWLDKARADAVQHGLLDVPAWGANTVRSEFAFLSGLRDDALGVHRFNPYRCLREVDTLAQALRRAGYRTVCVHPYAAGFYRRDRQFPLFGFDEFIDIGAFAASDRAGAYVGDVALAEKVAGLLQAAGPVFVFVITMENHGPLHLESVSGADEAALYASPPPPGHAELTAYLRHIVNAGQMLQRLRDSLSASARDGWLCWYGDHLPIMPAVYRQAGFDDARTDYFIWHASAAGGEPVREDLHMAELAECLLRTMQWRSGEADKGPEFL